jgi:hypothetical protein
MLVTVVIFITEVTRLTLRDYLRFYIEVGLGVGTFLPTPTPPKIPSDSNSTALVIMTLV